MTSSKWTPNTVKARLVEIIKDNVEISEKEVREIQRFFNEKSDCFLRRAERDLKRIENIKKYPWGRR